MQPKSNSPKAVYMRKYRLTHRDKLNEWKRKYYKKNKKRIVEQRKAYYQRNKKRLQKQSLEYYHENKEYCQTRNKEYTLKHRAEINVHARTRYYERQGREMPNKPFSLYRDFIKPASKLPKNERDFIFNAILKLPLNDQQRQLVRLTSEGHKQSDIAKTLHISQGAISRLWNGWSHNGIFYGGIANQLLKAINGKRKSQRQISVENMRSTLSRGVVE